MLEVYAEPKEALEDVAMAQWEEASVITVRGRVKSAGSLINHNLHNAAVLSSASAYPSEQHAVHVKLMCTSHYMRQHLFATTDVCVNHLELTSGCPSTADSPWSAMQPDTLPSIP
jgi:hypothetical protein